MKANTDETIMRNLRETGRSQTGSRQQATNWRVENERQLSGGDQESVNTAEPLLSMDGNLPKAEWNREVPPQVYRVQAEVDLQRGSDSRARLERLSSPAGSYTLLIFVHVWPLISSRCMQALPHCC